MGVEYHRIGTTWRDSFIYDIAGTAQTGKVQGDFTIELSKTGTGNQATTGITITEVDATNNAGEYAVDINSVTGCVANTGTYVLSITDTAAPLNQWFFTIKVTTTGTGSASASAAFFQSTSGDGRVTDSGGTAIEGATVYLRNSAGVLLAETTTDASGDWAANLETTATVYVNASGYQQGTATVTVSGGVATGPGANIALSAVTAGSGLTASSLWAYARRMARSQSGSLSDQQIKELVNKALYHIAKRYTSPWLERVAALTLQAPYTTGTLAITTDTATVTLTGGTFPSWAANGELYINGQFYPVSTRDSDTQLTLVSNFGDATVTAASYTLYQDSYDLPDDLYQFGELYYDNNWQWGPDPVGFLEFNRCKLSFHTGQENARVWCINRDDLRLWPHPSLKQTVQYSYYAKPAALASANDEADWDPAHLDLLECSIDYQVAKVYGETSGGLTRDEAKRILDDEITLAQDNNRKPMSRPSPMGGTRRRGSSLRHGTLPGS